MGFFVYQLLFAVVLVSMSVIGAVEVRRFRRSVPMIRTASDLERMKRLARKNMSLSLISIVAAAAMLGPIAFGYDFVHQLEACGRFHIYAHWVAWGSVALLWPIGRWGGERLLREEHPVEPELYSEFQDVVHLWRTRPFPQAIPLKEQGALSPASELEESRAAVSFAELRGGVSGLPSEPPPAT